MASGGLLTVLDDITVLLDDVAAMSKIAARKTAGIVGDDLAVNANVVVGLQPNRELPIVGKIALGSLANKAILVPLALALPTSVIQPVLMIGGAFLCYEALHKVMHRKDEQEEKRQAEMLQAAQVSPEALLEAEKTKIRGAIGTDAILSAEVIAVALGSVASAPLMTKALVLTLVSLVMTIGVYGLVAAIVKIDDLGLRMQKVQGQGAWAGFCHTVGGGLVALTPYLMKTLSVLGTLAMFIVGGGILIHGIPAAHHAMEAMLATLGGGELGSIVEMVVTLIAGALAGLICMPVFLLLAKGLSRIKARFSRSKAAAPAAPAASTVKAGNVQGSPSRP